jgi:ubiquinone/menaquinone biosynthesis C-methylase UbiE
MRQWVQLIRCFPSSAAQTVRENHLSREGEQMEQQSPDRFSAKRIAERLNLVYAVHAQSPTQRAIFRAVYGDDYPEEVVPLSYVTLSLLRRIAQEVALGPGKTLIDLGCGRGGPGLWMARATGATLVGVDLSSVAVEHASRRAKAFGVVGRAQFAVGDLTALPFADSSFDAAMSVDVLWMVPPNTLAALREIGRVSKPGARFVLTNWDRDLSPPGYPPPVSDHRSLLQEAGFAITTYEEVSNAESQRRAIYERYVASREALEQELGAAAEHLMFEARRSLGLEDGIDYLAHSRRIFGVAHKR